MIDVARSQPAPKSLARQKSYRGQDVIRRLREDFFGKCYLCEGFIPGSFSVEHLRPQAEFPDRVYDWSNLFPAHQSCNNRRPKWPDEGVLDPAGDEDVEGRLVQELRHKLWSSTVPGRAPSARNEAAEIPEGISSAERRRNRRSGRCWAKRQSLWRSSQEVEINASGHVGDCTLIFGPQAPDDSRARNTARELDRIHNSQHDDARALRRSILAQISLVEETKGKLLEGLLDERPKEVARERAKLRHLLNRQAPYSAILRSRLRVTLSNRAAVRLGIADLLC